MARSDKISNVQEPAIEVTTVCLHPDRGNWVIVAFFGIMGFALPILILRGKGPTSSADWTMTLLLGGMFLVPTLVFGYWQGRAIIVADEIGLRWRGMGGWHSAQWADVTDYYERIIPNGKIGSTLESTAGKLSLNPGLWTMTAELRDFITQYATYTQIKKWNIVGLRSEVDWPRIFDYNTTDNRFIRFVMPGMMLALLGFYFWHILQGFSKTLASLGVGWALATVGMSLFGLLPIGLMFWLSSRISSATTRRRSHCITLTLYGITYVGNDNRIAARWDEITDLYIAPRRNGNIATAYVVVTKHGTFDFLSSIREFAILCRALPIHATSLPEAKWRSCETDILGGSASRWTGRCEGAGTRIYHYRTRTNRALLFLAIFFAISPVLSIVLHHWTGNAIKGSSSFAYGLALFLGLPALLGFWRYATATVETDENGITQRTLFGTRHLAWSGVVDYYQTGTDLFTFGVVKGEAARLWFWIGIADVQQLKAEVARLAVNRLHQTWGKDAQGE